MKVAVTSSSFSAALERGELTHLEWLEACASRLDADGVVLALADFPRTDSEYAAQVKKVATDLGIVLGLGSFFAMVLPPFIGHWSDGLTTRWAPDAAEPISARPGRRPVNRR